MWFSLWKHVMYTWHKHPMMSHIEYTVFKWHNATAHCSVCAGGARCISSIRVQCICENAHTDVTCIVCTTSWCMFAANLVLASLNQSCVVGQMQSTVIENLKSYHGNPLLPRNITHHASQNLGQVNLWKLKRDLWMCVIFYLSGS